MPAVAGPADAGTDPGIAATVTEAQTPRLAPEGFLVTRSALSVQAAPVDAKTALTVGLTRQLIGRQIGIHGVGVREAGVREAGVRERRVDHMRGGARAGPKPHGENALRAPHGVAVHAGPVPLSTVPLKSTQQRLTQVPPVQAQSPPVTPQIPILGRVDVGSQNPASQVPAPGGQSPSARHWSRSTVASGCGKQTPI